jgi:Arc/MetJ-type ribon-helix-helix transcriptional regulator
MGSSNHLSVRIDDDLAEMLEEETEAWPYKIDKSEVVRTALREYLEGNAAQNQPVRAN